MRSLKLSSLFLIMFLSSAMHAQKGYIRGSVFDDATGEFLPGVTILLEGTTIGTLTDLDGKFNLEVAPGNYSLRASFISYETLFVKDLQVHEGKVVLLENLRLKETTLQLAEVTITAKEVRNTEAALMTIKMKSANVIDGISSVNFRKIGDADAAASLRRVSGLSVEGGKYVYVRGLGDRYTKTILNGVDIPGLDPDRNTLQMDLFPTSIIDNIIVNKSFTADLPADFTGGVIDMTLKDFPEEKQANISTSAGYNPSFHFTDDYLTYQGGKTDFLGYDDGTREIPATENIPFFSEVLGDPYGTKGLRYQEILKSFSPTLAAQKKTSFMDYGLGASFGNQFTVKKTTLGYNVALSYKSKTEYYRDAEYGRYGLSADPDIYEMDAREHQTGSYGTQSVLWSGLAGLALKTLKSKFSLNFLHLQNGESKAGIFDYDNNDQGAIFSGFQHNLEYSQRSLTNIFLNGKHSLDESRWIIEWKLSATFSGMDDPDIRFTRYIEDNEKYLINTESGFPERIWRELDETNYVGLVNVSRDFKIRQEKAQLKFGGLYTLKERDFAIRTYALNIRNLSLTGNPDELFYPENLWPSDGNANKGTTYEANFVPVNPNQFNADVDNIAGYISLEFSPLNNLRAILGVRMENYIQRYTGQNQKGDLVLNNDIVLDDLDFFPSLNLIYAITEKQNLRFSYSKTIARPSFKELSYAEIYDPISGRIFIGGLFPDADDSKNIVYWDGNLVSTDIHNIDLRWELFGSMNQTLSVSGFYKKFLKPIEIVQYATLPGAFQPRNVGDGRVFGAEVEFRVALENLAESLKNFSLAGNLTYTRSYIKLSPTEYASRLEIARTGQTIDEYRVMAGQAPYIVNVGISYNGGENGFWNGLEAGLYYNVQGLTLQYVGIDDRPDIYVKPFNSFNFNANKSFGEEKRLQVGLKIENIFNDKKESVYRSYEAADQYFERYGQGATFSVSIRYSIF